MKIKMYCDGDNIITSKGTFKISKIKDFYMDHTRKELAAYLNVNERYVRNILREAKIKKPIEKILEGSKRTNLKKYGVATPFESKDIQNKILKNNLKKYGYENQFSRPEVKEKIKQTLLERYGVEHNSQTENYKIKYKLTCLEKYGVDNYSLTEEYKQKVKNTNNLKYGVDYFSQTKDWYNKIKEAWNYKDRDELIEIEAKRKLTKLIKYGDENYRDNNKRKITLIETYGSWENYINSIKLKADNTRLLRYGDKNYNNREKFEKTMIERYGVRSFAQTKLFKTNRRKLYVYNEEYFDSLTELAYYIYMFDNGHKIERCPYIFTFNFNGKQHAYHPDFLIDGEIIEIKGDHFIKEDGTLQNPYDHSQDNLFNAKYKCMLENNVKLIRHSECKDYIKYLLNLNIDIEKLK